MGPIFVNTSICQDMSHTFENFSRKNRAVKAVTDHLTTAIFYVTLIYASFQTFDYNRQKQAWLSGPLSNYSVSMCECGE